MDGMSAPTEERSSFHGGAPSRPVGLDSVLRYGVDAQADLETNSGEAALVTDGVHETMTESIGRDVARFTAPMIRLLAEGRPVALERVAAEAGVPVDEIESWLRGQPGTDWDDSGQLLGFGLTQRPTRHRYIIDGRVLFTFCAADTLLFTPLLGRPASVESSCPTTGQTISVELTPQAVTSVDPTTAVVSQINLRGASVSDIRASLCDHGHFFASERAAQPWLSAHPDGEVRPVAEFFDHALGVCRKLGWTP
jgi:alkylmercury lyase